MLELDGELLAATHVCALEPVSRDACQAIVAGTLPSDRVEEADVDRLLSAAGGNPFLLTTLARHLAVGGSVGDIPVGVEQFVRQAVATLPDDARRLLDIVALEGDAVALDVLTSAARGSVGADDLDALVASGLLVDEGNGVLTFRHGVVREAVEAQLGAADRAGGHTALAHAHLAAADASAADVVRHLRQAYPTTSRPLLPVWLARLGTEALAGGAPLAAAAALQEAAELGQEHTDVATVLGWRLERVWALVLVGQLDTAFGEAIAIAERARTANLPEAFARAAVAATGPMNPVGEQQRRVESLLLEALDWLPDEPSSLRVDCLEAARRAALMRFGPDLTHDEGQRAELEKYLAVSHDPVTAALAALGLRYDAHRRGVPSLERLILSTRARVLAGRSSHELLQLAACRAEVADAVGAADPDIAQHLDRLADRAASSSSALYVWEAHVLGAALAGAGGDADGASQCWSRAAEVEAGVDPLIVQRTHTICLFADSYRRRDLDLLTAGLAGDIPGLEGFEEVIAAARLAVAAELGEPVDASDALGILASATPFVATAVAALLAVVGAVLKDEQLARAVIHVLTPRNRDIVVLDGATVILGPVAAYLDLVSPGTCRSTKTVGSPGGPDGSHN